MTRDVKKGNRNSLGTSLEMILQDIQTMIETYCMTSIFVKIFT